MWALNFFHILNVLGGSVKSYLLPDGNNLAFMKLFWEDLVHRNWIKDLVGDIFEDGTKGFLVGLLELVEDQVGVLV